MMDIKKIESNKNDFMLFLSRKELGLIERILLERVVRSKKGNDYHPSLSEYTATESHTAEILRNEIWDELHR